MGFLKRLFRKDKPENNPYVVSGMTALMQLPLGLGLAGGNDAIQKYTPEEQEAIDAEFSRFQQDANDIAGDEVFFHSGATPLIQLIQRALASQALIELADRGCMLSDDTPGNWKALSAVYIKAWFSTFDPKALQGLGDLLVQAGRYAEAETVFRVLLKFPAYSSTYFEGEQTPEIVRWIVSRAEASLSQLP